jgi:hypothetical protein
MITHNCDTFPIHIPNCDGKTGSNTRDYIDKKRYECESNRIGTKDEEHKEARRPWKQNEVTLGSKVQRNKKARGAKEYEPQI